MKEKRPLRKVEALKIYRELKKVNDEQSELGFHELKEPRQKGWKSNFEVRADVMFSSKAEIFERILPLIQNREVVRKHEHLRLNGFVVEKMTTSGWVEVDFSTISAKKKEQSGLPDHYWTKYFYSYEHEFGFYSQKKETRWALKNSFYRCFQGRIVPHFIYSIPIIDPALESREKFLRAKMDQNNYWRFVFGRNRDDLPDWRQDELLKEFYREIREELSAKNV